MIKKSKINKVLTKLFAQNKPYYLILHTVVFFIKMMLTTYLSYRLFYILPIYVQFNLFIAIEYVKKIVK